MRRFFAMLLAAALLVLPARAANGSVRYDGDAGSVIFQPGSEYSPTDLFPELKDVMPGDTLTQRITLKNDSAKGVKIKIYLRALGAQEGSESFLSQLGLRVRTTGGELDDLFDAAADETAQLTDWVCLGMLYSGGEVELEVILEVPAELGNEFQDCAGYLDWEFMIEEFPVEDTDPTPPKTGDRAVWPWAVLLTGSALGLALLAARKRENERETGWEEA